MPTRRIVQAALVLALSSSGLWALNLELLKGSAASLHWDGPQFIQADAQGNVYLLRGDTLQVYPVSKAHDLSDPVQLEMGGVHSGSALDAAMSRDGKWVVMAGGAAHYFVDAHEKPLPPLGWFPTSVGFLRDEPVALVVPRNGGDDNPPLLLKQGIDTWSTEIREALHSSPVEYGTERAYRAAMVLDGREGQYLLARQYAYRIELRRLGRGQPLEELRLGKGEPIFKKPIDCEEQQLAAQARANGTDTSHSRISVFRGSTALLALARGGPQGRLYALVGPGVAGEHCALDRIDWDERRVERLALDLPCNGRASMAAGRDGLYLAGFDGETGRFFAGWSALEAAKWSAVKEAEFTP